MHDIVIIGAGPAGEAAASTIRRLDKTVNIALIEKEAAGGLCLNKGCIPSKTLLEYAHRTQIAQKPFNWIEAQTIKNNVVASIRIALETRLKRENISLIKGSARFVSPTSLEILSSSGCEQKTFDVAVIAIGNEIFLPTPLEPFKEQILTSDSLLQLTKTPSSIAIIGGGAIGCEFACLLNAAGSQVTIIEMKDQLLPGEDTSVATTLASSYEKRGILIKTGATVQHIQKQSLWELTLSTGEVVTSEQVLSCVGRTPQLTSLNLDQAGVSVGPQGIVIDSFGETTNPRIYAVGDVAGSRLAHHAAQLGEKAAAHIMGQNPTCDNDFVPRCLYSWPEVASIGEWKYEREQKGLNVKATRSFFKGSARAMAATDTEGFVQIISDPESNQLLGAQIIGPHATELIHIFSVALKARLSVKQLESIVFAHPTLAESIKEALRK